ncbi:uncharacterized protein [Bos indicus]|uniref:Uncharacterized protein isoform X5 n=1 Tax=Bos indicus TaxID=9915 RepID=A0ABM4QK14_BOSIN
MPPDHLVLKKETRMLGAVQVMIGLINGALGRIWLLFYTRQFEELSVEYKPIALLSGYPFWTFLFFIISGVLTIQTEKKRSPNSVLTLFRRAGLWEGENQQTVECEEQGRVIKKIPNGKVRFVTVYASTTTDASGTDVSLSVQRRDDSGRGFESLRVQVRTAVFSQEQAKKNRDELDLLDMTESSLWVPRMPCL